ncbi:hypothetical protein SynRS9907_01204 [Synechococcus sp. RS9907]|nr:hypothetical protein SynRS9907_01204 [Synechococcus sp. RS9907]
MVLRPARIEELHTRAEPAPHTGKQAPRPGVVAIHRANGEPLLEG